MSLSLTMIGLAQADSNHFYIQKLSPGVFAAIHNNDGGYAICNAGIIDLGERTLIFDPFISPVAARDLRMAAKELTGRFPTLVVNSHYHNDHVRGNQVFENEAEIIATEQARFIMDTIFAGEVAYEEEVVSQRIRTFSERLEKASDAEKGELVMWVGYYHALKESHDELRNVLPTLTIEDDLTIHGTLNDVELKVMKGGHTPGDLVLWIPEHRIVFTGDQVFEDCHPWLADGDPEFLIEDLKTMISWQPEIVVPGHGRVSDIEEIKTNLDYIVSLMDMVALAIQEGKTENEVAEFEVLPKWASWWYGRFYPWNLRFLYGRYKR